MTRYLQFVITINFYLKKKKTKPVGVVISDPTLFTYSYACVLLCLLSIAHPLGMQIFPSDQEHVWFYQQVQKHAWVKKDYKRGANMFGISGKILCCLCSRKNTLYMLTKIPRKFSIISSYLIFY